MERRIPSNSILIKCDLKNYILFLFFFLNKVLVGHSMGGAIAVHTAASNYIKNLIALVVIDVVEGEKNQLIL